MKPESTWTDLAHAWAVMKDLPAEARRGELWLELREDALALARKNPAAFWDWFLALGPQDRKNGSLVANVLWKWTAPVPKRAYDALVRAAVEERCPSFNRTYVEPIVRTYGRDVVVASLLVLEERGTPAEKDGAEQALYWARRVEPMTAERRETQALSIERAAASKVLTPEQTAGVAKEVARRRQWADELRQDAKLEG